MGAHVRSGLQDMAKFCNSTESQPYKDRQSLLLVQGPGMHPMHGVVVQIVDAVCVCIHCVCRNFRTLTAPTAVQFVSLAVEPAGEVVVAGTQDDFQVCVDG